MDAIRNRARAKKWAQDNPERYKARQAKYRAENKERLREYRAQWHVKNKVRVSAAKAQKRAADPTAAQRVHKKRYVNPDYANKCRQRSKKWRAQNPEISNEKNKEWRKANPEKAKSIARAGWINRRARIKAIGKISADDVRAVRTRERCEVCGNIHERMEIDHIVPISRGGTNHLTNLQLLCRPCNRSKWAKDFHAWLVERGAT